MAPNDVSFQLYRAMPTMIDMAFKARERAVSHRPVPFKVGAVALVCDAEGKYGYLDGANYKPHADGPRKCAEEEILQKAEELGVNVIGVAIVAPHQPDDHTGIDLGVTPCCMFCRRLIRDKLKAERPRITEDTHLVFINADLPTVRVDLPVRTMLDIFNGE